MRCRGACILECCFLVPAPTCQPHQRPRGRMGDHQNLSGMGSWQQCHHGKAGPCLPAEARVETSPFETVPPDLFCLPCRVTQECHLGASWVTRETRCQGR